MQSSNLEKNVMLCKKYIGTFSSTSGLRDAKYIHLLEIVTYVKF